jgi:hypothetical protein
MERRDSENSCREAIERIASEVPAMMVEVPGKTGGGMKLEMNRSRGSQKSQSQRDQVPGEVV